MIILILKKSIYFIGIMKGLLNVTAEAEIAVKHIKAIFLNYH